MYYIDSFFESKVMHSNCLKPKYVQFTLQTKKHFFLANWQLAISKNFETQSHFPVNFISSAELNHPQNSYVIINICWHNMTQEFKTHGQNLNFVLCYFLCL